MWCLVSGLYWGLWNTPGSYDIDQGEKTEGRREKEGEGKNKEINLQLTQTKK